MTIESALWMQNVDYPARLDRALIAAMYDEGTLDLVSFTVSERGAGANFSIDASAGKAVVTGDDEPAQGNYFVASTDVENVTLSAAPGSNSRYDLVVLQVNDENAGGAATNDVTLAVITGAVSASPVVPTVGNSAIPLAVIGPITAATPSITNNLIADARVIAGRKDSPGTLAHRADSQVPSGWLLCDGSNALVATYPALAAQLGTTYGGDGVTTFGLPDGAGRVLTGPGGSLAGITGDTGGATTHTISQSNLPAHTHSMAQHTHTSPSHTHSTPGHTHSISHDHAAFTSATDAHTHSIAHDHASFTATGGSHAHTIPLYNNLGADGATGPNASSSSIGSQVSTNTSSSHSHTINVPNFSGNSGSDTHSHSINVPNFSGTSGSGGASTTGGTAPTTNTGGATDTGSVGSGVAVSLLQPYQVVGGLVIRT